MTVSKNLALGARRESAEGCYHLTVDCGLQNSSYTVSYYEIVGCGTLFYKKSENKLFYLLFSISDR